jgi:hypothetical protein
MKVQNVSSIIYKVDFLFLGTINSPNPFNKSISFTFTTFFSFFQHIYTKVAGKKTTTPTNRRRHNKSPPETTAQQKRETTEKRRRKRTNSTTPPTIWTIRK